jgi:hypothetical protein
VRAWDVTPLRTYSFDLETVLLGSPGAGRMASSIVIVAAAQRVSASKG